MNCDCRNPGFACSSARPFGWQVIEVTLASADQDLKICGVPKSLITRNCPRQVAGTVGYSDPLYTRHDGAQIAGSLVCLGSRTGVMSESSECYSFGQARFRLLRCLCSASSGSRLRIRQFLRVASVLKGRACLAKHPPQRKTTLDLGYFWRIRRFPGIQNSIWLWLCCSLSGGPLASQGSRAPDSKNG